MDTTGRASAKLTCRLSIDTPSTGFRWQVTVEGSPDAREWAVLRKGAAIYDFGGDVPTRSTLVTVPETSFRHLRVTIHDSDKAPLTVSGVRVERETRRPARRVTLKPVGTSISSSSPPSATHFLLDLGLPHLPCDQVEIQFSNDNVRRQCQIAASEAPGGPWFPSRCSRA